MNAVEVLVSIVTIIIAPCTLTHYVNSRCWASFHSLSNIAPAADKLYLITHSVATLATTFSTLLVYFSFLRVVRSFFYEAFFHLSANLQLSRVLLLGNFFGHPSLSHHAALFSWASSTAVLHRCMV